MAAEEDLRVGRPDVCLVGHLSWDHFGLGLPWFVKLHRYAKEKVALWQVTAATWGNLAFQS